MRRLPSLGLLAERVRMAKSAREIRVIAAALLRHARRTQGTGDAAMTAVVEVVAAEYRVTPAQVLSRSRNERIARARAVAIYLCRRLKLGTTPAIGDFFGRDHSTVISHCKALAASGPARAATLDRLAKCCVARISQEDAA